MGVIWSIVTVVGICLGFSLVAMYLTIPRKPFPSEKYSQEVVAKFEQSFITTKKEQHNEPSNPV